jgi:folate-binding protein YgfZ
MKAALLPDRGVVKVAGDPARKFLNGLVTSDMNRTGPAEPRFTALLTPQGKIIVDFIAIEAGASEGGGFFLDCPRALAPELVERLNFYKLRAKVIIEDLSETLGIMAIWDDGKANSAGSSALGAASAWKCYPDPRFPEMGMRCMLPPHLAAAAAAGLGAEIVDAAEYEIHRIQHGIPKGGLDFVYGDAFPHEADMDQLAGVDFDKGCFVGQEVVSRVEHRGTARTRVIPVVFPGAPPKFGATVTAGDKGIGVMGSAIKGRGLAALRLDRVEAAISDNVPIVAGEVALEPVKPPWAKFAFRGRGSPQK